MKDSFDEIEELFAVLQSLRPLSREQQEKVDKKFRLEFSYNSNHLEGNTLTYGETELLLIFDDTKGNHTLREYEEMKAHDVAYQLIEEWANDYERPLSEQHIKNLNEIILVRPYWKEAITEDGQNTRRQIKVGQYKEFPNSVRLANGEIFHYTSPGDTPIEMQELIEWYRSEESGLHPITLAAMLHYKFVRIHPFDDGNGRISRLLVNYVLIRNNYPPIIIKSDDKQNYLRALHLADIGDYEPFIRYIAEQVFWSLDIYIKAAKGEDIEEKDDWEKEMSLWKKGLDSQNVIPKSDDYIVEIYIKGLNSLLSLFEEEMEIKFSDLFTEWKIRGYINNSNSGNKGKEYIDERFSNLSREIATNVIRVNTEQINSLDLNISMLGFKKERLNTFNIDTKIEVYFEQYKYILICSPGQKIEKLYGEWLSRIEQKEILSVMAKEIYRKIKQSMSNPALSDLD